jgi:hypothetical protein
MAQSFDNLCRILASPMSRSKAIKLIAGGLAAAVLAPLGLAQNAPSGSSCAGVRGGKCPRGQTCCAGVACCGAGSQCIDGTCRKVPPSTGKP